MIQHRNYVVHSTIRLPSLAAPTTNYLGPQCLLVNIFKCQNVVHYTSQVTTSPRQDKQRYYLVAVLSTALTKKIPFVPNINRRTKFPDTNQQWMQVMYIQWICCTRIPTAHVRKTAILVLVLLLVLLVLLCCSYILLLLLLLLLLSIVTDLFFLVLLLNSDPHRSRFKFQTAVLSILCVMFLTSLSFVVNIYM
jgi:hypothetical protein